MRLDDGPADREPHAGPLGLRGKECTEDLVKLFRGESHARVLDRDQELLVLSRPLNEW